MSPSQRSSSLIAVVSAVAVLAAAAPARATVVAPPPELWERRPTPRKGLPWAKPGENFAVWVDTMNVALGITSGGLATAENTWFYRAQPWPDAQVVVLFTTRSNQATFAFYSPLANDIQGIGYGASVGIETFDLSPDGTEGFVFGNNFHIYLQEPFYLPLVVLQELGHRWCCFVREADGQPTNKELLGRDDAHWSYFLDTGGSSMEGNAWVWNGGDSFTTSTAAVYAAGGGTTPFSQLDLWIMGLLPTNQVGPFFVIQNPDVMGQKDVFGGTIHRASPPQYVGDVTITGTKFDFTIEDVIAANGNRIPAPGSWDGQFRVAFVLLVQPGEEANGIMRSQFRSIVDQAIDIWATATGGRSQLVNVTTATFGGEYAACDGAARNCGDGLECATYQGTKLCAARCDGWCGEGKCCVDTDAGRRCLSPEVVACAPDAPHATGERCEDGRPCEDGGICYPAPGFDASYCAGPCSAPADCPTGMSCREANDGHRYCFWDGAPPGATGAPCTTSDECDSNICAGGRCVSLCDPGAPMCAPGTVCRPASDGQHVCVLDEGGGGGGGGFPCGGCRADGRGAAAGGAAGAAGAASAGWAALALAGLWTARRRRRQARVTSRGAPPRARTRRCSESRSSGRRAAPSRRTAPAAARRAARADWPR